jgi:hypothetical protein
MTTSLIKTELICPSIWKGRTVIVYMPVVFEKEQVFLDFTIKDLTHVKGLFLVEQKVHIVEASGYVQRLKVETL